MMLDKVNIVPVSSPSVELSAFSSHLLASSRWLSKAVTDQITSEMLL